jgi:hypothetical protein
MSPKSYLIQLIVDAIKKNELKNAKKISETLSEQTLLCDKRVFREFNKPFRFFLILFNMKLRYLFYIK